MITTKSHIAALALTGGGIALLVWGPDAHAYWGGILITAGLGILGWKPGANAIGKLKGKKQ